MIKNYFILFLFPIFLYSSNYSICIAQRFDTEYAKTQIEKILEKETQNVQCLIQLSNIYLKEGKLTKGFDILTEAYSIDSNVVKNSEMAKIIPFALQVTALKNKAQKNNDYNSWNKLADGYYDLGILSEAIVAYKKSLGINSKQNNIRLKLGLAYKKNGQIYSCENEIRTVLLNEKDNFYANYYMAKILKYNLDRPSKAIDYFKSSYKILIKQKNKFKYTKYKNLLDDILKELK